MKLEGKLIAVYEDRRFSWYSKKTGSTTPLLSIAIVVAIEQKVYDQSKKKTYKLPTLVVFEYICPDFKKKEQYINENPMYLRLFDMGQEKNNFDNYIVGVTYSFKTNKKHDEEKYFTKLKMEDIEVLSTYDNDSPNQEVDNDYVDESD